MTNGCGALREMRVRRPILAGKLLAILPGGVEEPLDMAGGLIEDEVRALRIANEEANMAVARLDEQAMSPKVKVAPSPGGALVDEIDKLSPRQQPNMVGQGKPRAGIRKMGKTARSVPCTLVDKSHATTIANTCDNEVSQRARLAANCPNGERESYRRAAIDPR